MAPRTHGLYRRFSSGTSVSWLRFTADGAAFAAATSPGWAAQIATWLRPGAPAYIAQGRWSIEGGEAVYTLEYRLAMAATMLVTRLHERARSTDDWATINVSCRIESSSADYDGKSWRDTYQFVAVEPRWLDGDATPRTFRSFSSTKALAAAGLGEETLAEIRRCKGATLAMLNALEASELVALGLSRAAADAVVALRIRLPSAKKRAK
ncbi:MAG: hypothetical protein U0269_22685 [Polyangiales bacterium]